MQIGSYSLRNNLVLAPMAGITDKPFRQLCRQLGAGLSISEMVSSNPVLLRSKKTRLRIDHSGEDFPRVVQIAGADPGMTAESAAVNVAQGADIIDINMGCPAKKVCNVRAGSALLKDEKLVTEILTAVVKAVSVPVTLKMRTGWDAGNRNALEIARIARKHIAWYCNKHHGTKTLLALINKTDNCKQQLTGVEEYFFNYGEEELAA